MSDKKFIYTATQLSEELGFDPPTIGWITKKLGLKVEGTHYVTNNRGTKIYDISVYETLKMIFQNYTPEEIEQFSCIANPYHIGDDNDEGFSFQQLQNQIQQITGPEQNNLESHQQVCCQVIQPPSQNYPNPKTENEKLIYDSLQKIFNIRFTEIKLEDVEDKQIIEPISNILPSPITFQNNNHT